MKMQRKTSFTIFTGRRISILAHVSVRNAVDSSSRTSSSTRCQPTQDIIAAMQPAANNPQPTMPSSAATEPLIPLAVEALE